MSEHSHEVCQSFRTGKSICKDGFPQKPICMGYGACHSCGAYSDRSVPWCEREDIPAHFLHENGRTIFVQEPSS